MTQPLGECSRGFGGADVRLSFAGSDELAAQIRQGVKPDVYAAASTSIPAALQAEGRVEAPVEFVANSLVVAVPRGSAIRTPEALARSGTTVVVGSESVPVGSYTRELLSRFPPTLERRILANVRSEEPDARGIVGKLVQGAADAGFVYASDVRAAAGELRAIPLPGELQPAVVYAAAVVRGAAQPALARRYVRGLADGRCQRALLSAGFAPIK
jgi:molybdate transport system substrate-binding protein